MMRLRLILSFLLVVLVAIGGITYFARQSTSREVQAFMFQGNMTDANEVVSILENYYNQNGGWAGVDSIISSSTGAGRFGQGMGGMMGQRIQITDAAGNIVADSANSPTTGTVSAAVLSQALPLHDAQGKLVGYLLASSGVAFQAGQGTQLINRLNQAALQAALFAGGIALIVALLLSFSFLRPVDQLTRAAKAMAKGDLAARVPARGNDEMAVLGRAFNQMADSIQKAEASRRSMIADIAHELRTPLSVQQAQLEAFQDEIDPITPDNIHNVLEQNHQLVRLVDDLRTLALADDGELRIERVPTDLAILVQTALERFGATANQRRIRLEFECSSKDGCTKMNLDPGRIEQILNNLLSNALRHTPEQGEICVRLVCSSQAAELSVRDSGTGIPAEALPHIFERFYRAERSRSREEGGTGLGLAIARQLARLHGGDLTAANAPQGGALFTLRLPG
ncbi:MAG: ATP-binding protein [Chloroflexi bacterium]|nr:ATP-binding protein [Chloroflexota bacterium]